MGSSAAPLAARLVELKSKLEKKATFEHATRELSALLSNADAASVEAATPVLKRALVLLQTRYSGRGYWVAGRELFSLPALAGSNLAKSALESCSEHLAGSDDDVPGPAGEGPAAFRPPARPPPFLFEGQMSGEGPDLATTNARSEAATMELLHAALFAEFRGQQDDADAAPTTSGADGDGSGGGGGGGERTAGQGGDTQQQPARRPDAANAARIFAALRSLAESRGEEFVGLEEALAASLLDGGRPAGPPPASKRAVAALKVEVVSAARLAELGDGCQCAVCRDELVVRDEIQVMPCKHVFHPTCLAPWLEQHCSCPVCRTELPTDDHKYEEMKERRKEQEEEERGAANAVRGGEFVYI